MVEPWLALLGSVAGGVIGGLWGVSLKLKDKKNARSLEKRADWMEEAYAAFLDAAHALGPLTRGQVSPEVLQEAADLGRAAMILMEMGLLHADSDMVKEIGTMNDLLEELPAPSGGETSANLYDGFVDFAQKTAERHRQLFDPLDKLPPNAVKELMTRREA